MAAERLARPHDRRALRESPPPAAPRKCTRLSKARVIHFVTLQYALLGLDIHDGLEVNVRALPLPLWVQVTYKCRSQACGTCLGISSCAAFGSGTSLRPMS